MKDEDLLRVSETLDKFAQTGQQKAELVNLRHLVGMTLEESAEVMRARRSI